MFSFRGEQALQFGLLHLITLAGSTGMLTCLVLAVACVARWPVYVSAQTVDETALLIIDVQDCFLPNGSLAVTDGDQVIPVINRIRQDFEQDFSLVVLSQDWHCPDHVSFASQHEGGTPYSLVNLTYNSEGRLCREDSIVSSDQHGVRCSPQKSDSDMITVTQTLWPDHCIKNVTSGPTSAAFSDSLKRKDSDVVIRKGFNCDIDSYSAFYDNGGFRQTELNSVLKQHNVGRVVVTGLALDYCVYYTSLDAHKLGYKVITVTDAARGVAPDSTSAALSDMEANGIELVKSESLRAALDTSSNKATSSWDRHCAVILLSAMVLIHTTNLP
ncbi:hypothetical protein BaRGS_00007777 [Batillaria attramentaria]|uniref:nicotinamidase n=1 Tax=Batillaria attramentaria TaxID=370345 RepID=A0ABD0LMU0_9CAEN